MIKPIVQKAGTAVGALLCMIFLFLLGCNVTIIAKGILNPDMPPTVLGVTPMVVLSGSMSGNAEDHIEAGDLIFSVKPDLSSLKEGDVISYMSGKTVITHRLIRIETGEQGEIRYITKGDANNEEDPPVSEQNIIGICRFRIPRLGDAALFLQQPAGMALCIGIPVLALLFYDLRSRRHIQDQNGEEVKKLKEELEALRAAAQETNEKGD